MVTEKLTQEILDAFNQAVRKAPTKATDVRERGLRAVLPLVEKDLQDRITKLEGALHLAGQSRDLWRDRAISAGWVEHE